MAELSTAAQAVLAAIHAAPDDTRDSHRSAGAAAIRAAARELALPVRRGLVRVEDLLAIAAELEGATPDPLEPNDLSHLSEDEFQALAPQGYHGV